MHLLAFPCGSTGRSPCSSASVRETIWGRLQPSSVEGAYYAYQSFVGYAIREGWIEEGAIRKEDRPSPSAPLTVSIYSPREIDRLIEEARATGDIRFWMPISFLALTGRRIGEARSLRWDWLRLDHEPPYFELPHQKNGKPQFIPLGSRMMDVVSREDLSRLRTRMPYSRKAGTGTYLFPYAYTGVARRFERLCQQAGLPYRGLHNLRHS